MSVPVRPSRRRLALLALGLSAALAAPAASAASLDLGGSIVNVRRGFDPATIASPPVPGTIDWLALAADSRRSLAVRDLLLEGEARPGPFDLGSRPPESFTIAFVFEADLSLINTTGLAVKVPRAGQGWALYLNGSLVRDELRLRPDGSFAAERSLRNTIIPLDKRLLKPGRNVLAFHVRGDPRDERTGLPGKGSILIDGYSRLVSLDREYLDIMFIGVYALFGLYHFILFAQRPKDRSNLFYGLSTLVLALFLFTRTQAATLVVPDTALLGRIDNLSLFLILPAFLAFFDKALGERVSPFSKASLAFGLALAPLSFLARPEVAHNLWEAGAAVGIAYLFALVLVPKMARAAREAEPGRRLRALLSSAAGRLSAGSLVAAAAVVADILAVNSGGEMLFSKYAFLFLVVGAAALLADQYVSVYRELEALSVSLERKVAERSLELESAVERQRRLGAEIERKGRALSEAADASGRDLKIAERLQRGLFPARPPEVSGWDIALDYRPASGVSGDFYDFFVEAGELKGLAVGDVSGHGVGAGLVAVLARSVFARRFAALGQGALGDCLAGIHAELVRELGGVDEYLTCLMLRIEGGRVEYANAAHPDLLFRRAGQDLARPLVPKGREGFRGPPLGKEGFEGSWTALRFAPAPGDILLAFTDCLEEARNAAGERYGRARLEASVGRAPSGSARGLLDAVLGDITAFAGSEALDDDLTAIVLRRLP